MAKNTGNKNRSAGNINATSKKENQTMATKEKEIKGAKKFFLHANNEETRSATPDATALKFDFGGGDVEILPLSKFPDNIRKCAVLHGLSQKLGDSYAGKDDARESFNEMRDRLFSGEWVSARRAEGPRVTLLFEAIKRALEKNKRPVDEEKIRARISDSDGRKKAMANPIIAAEYEAIKAERANARAKEAAAAAKGAELTDFS